MIAKACAYPSPQTQAAGVGPSFTPCTTATANQFLGCDTETIWLGSAYVVTAATLANQADQLTEGQTWYWEGMIDPHKKTVAWTAAQLAEMEKVLGAYCCGGHNFGLYDYDRLREILPALSFENYFDTQVASHVYNNEEPHGAKYLAFRYLDIPDTDETESMALVQQARQLILSARRYLKGPRKVLPAPIAAWPQLSAFSYTTQACEWLAEIEIAPNKGTEGKRLLKSELWLTAALGLPGREKYPCTDARRHIWLWAFYSQALQKLDLVSHYTRRLLAHPAIRAMRYRGLQLRPEEVARVTADCQSKLEACETWARDRGYNIASPQQVGKVLFSQLGLPPIKQNKTGPSTDKAVLLELTQRARGAALTHLKNIWTYRKAAKTYGYLQGPSGYARLCDEHWVLRPELIQTGTATPRWSSRRPNGQNVPKRNDADPEKQDLRCIIGPRPGFMLCPMDYEQLELRIFLWFVGRKLDFDVHQQVGDKVAEFLGVDGGGPKNRRQAGKHGVVYPTIYGSGARTSGISVARQLNIPALGRETEIGRIGQQALFEVIPEVKDFLYRTTEEAKRTGMIRTAYGYPLRVPWRPKEKPYAGVDYKCQGTAGQIAELAVIRTYEYICQHEIGYLLLQIHDELLFELSLAAPPEHLFAIKLIMEDSGLDGLEVPVEVKICREHWGHGEKFTYDSKRAA